MRNCIVHSVVVVVVVVVVTHMLAKTIVEEIIKTVNGFLHLPARFVMACQ